MFESAEAPGSVRRLAAHAPAAPPRGRFGHAPGSPPARRELLGAQTSPTPRGLHRGSQVQSYFYPHPEEETCKSHPHAHTHTELHPGTPPGRGAADSGPRSNARVCSHRPLDQAPAASHGGPGLIRPAALDSTHSAVRPRSASCPHPVPFSPCAVGQGNDANAALSTVLTVSPPFSTHPSTPSLVDLTPDPLAHAEAGLETPALGSRAPPHLPGCGLRPVRDRPAYRGRQHLLQRSVGAQHPRRELPRGHSHSQRCWPHTLLPAPCPLIPLASLTAGPPGCARCWPHCVPCRGRCPRQPGSRR